MPHWMNQTTRRESRSPMLISMPSTSHRVNFTANGTISSNREHAQPGNLFPYSALGGVPGKGGEYTVNNAGPKFLIAGGITGEFNSAFHEAAGTDPGYGPDDF